MPHKYITDLKVVKDVNEAKWVKDLGHLDFIQYWGYDVQGAVYQELVYQNTGEKLPFFIAVADKTEHPFIDVIKVEQHVLDEALNKVWYLAPGILALLKGEREPDRCETCDCCKESRVLTHWTSIDDLPLRWVV